MRKFRVLLLAGFAIGTLTAAEVEIRAISDLHGRLEQLARLEKVLKVRDPEVLRLDAGDSATGGFAAQRCGLPGVLQILGELNFDLWVPGNHDLEQGEVCVTAAARNFRGAVLGADWRGERFRPLPWQTFTKKGFRLAVIGLTEPSLRRRRTFHGEFQYASHADTLARIMPEVRAARPDLVILVRHGSRHDAREPLYELLKPYPEIRLVIGAHTHQRVPGVRVGGAWFVQPGCHGEAAAVITAEFDDRSRRFLRIRSGLAETPAKGSPVSLSPSLNREIAASRRRGSQIVGRTAAPLRWPVSRKDRQASLGIWAAELLLQAVPEAEAVCIALPVRQEGRPLAPEITARELFRVFPYENPLRLVTVSPAVLNQLMEDRDFCRYAVPFWAEKGNGGGTRHRHTSKREKSALRLLTTEYLAASHPLLRQAPGRTLPLTDFEAAAQALAAGEKTHSCLPGRKSR